MNDYITTFQAPHKFKLEQSYNDLQMHSASLRNTQYAALYMSILL